MKRAAIYLGCLLVGVMLTHPRAMAADDSLAQPTATAIFPSLEPLPASGPGFWDQDALTGDWGGWRKKLEDHGIELSASYTAYFQGNPSGGRDQGFTADGLFYMALDLDFGKMTDGRIPGLIFHTNALYNYGRDISQEYIGDFSGVDPIVAYNAIRLQELWLEKSFWNDRLFIRAGNLAIDNDFFVSASSSLYINSMINTLITPIAINVPNTPIYPVASPGVRVKFLPTPQTYMMVGVYGMDKNSNPATTNRNGTRFSLAAGSGALIMTEVGYLLNQRPQDKGLHGTYRIGSFVHTANYDTWDSQAQNAMGAGPLKNGGPNFGIYGLAEQQIYAHNAQSISFFAGGGGAPSDINFLAWSLEAGINFAGFIPGRDHDVAGVSFARSTVSGNFSDNAVSLGSAPYTVQSVVEATYRIQITPWWYVQPDFQYIINPGATNSIHNAVVLGMSTSIVF